MTTNITAAAWSVRKSVTLMSFAVFLGFALAGCSTTGPSILSGDGSATQQLTQNAAQANANQIAIAPVIGAPEQVAKQLQAQLTNSMQKRGIGVASGAAAKYTLRGYVVSAREGTGTKISYIWDVTDPTGKRVNRISGEEITPASSGRDPWASVTPAVMTTISDKTATSLASWLPSQAPKAPAVAGAIQTAPAGAATAARQTASSTVQQARATANQAVRKTTTGSIGRGATNAIVPNVTGAPGDGSVSLTRAIRSELSRNGVTLASTASPQSYRVQGKVSMKQASAQKQEISIDWAVYNPQGKNVGTVSQKNAIPAGSLDGAWGRTADAAAAAAAQGILKLLKDK
ncbi:MAG: hypothetical protein RIC14_14520 [Filomicrobium sp.]